MHTRHSPRNTRYSLWESRVVYSQETYPYLRLIAISLIGSMLRNYYDMNPD